MYYITYGIDKRVITATKKKPLSVSKDCKIGEVEKLPKKYDYLYVEKETGKKRVTVKTVVESVELVDADGNPYTDNREKEYKQEEDYIEVTLVPKFLPGLSEDVLMAKRKIALLKRKLTLTDYEAIKYAEGVMAESEYMPIKEEREIWRKEINELEKIK